MKVVFKPSKLCEWPKLQNEEGLLSYDVTDHNQLSPCVKQQYLCYVGCLNAVWEANQQKTLLSSLCW